MMHTVDLVLLGCLLVQPMSAYEVNRELAQRNLGHWVRIGRATVYKNLLALAKAGYLQGEKVSGQGTPDKTQYSLTPAGREYFAQLMDEVAAREPEILFDWNAVVANLNKIPPEQALRQIDQLESGLVAKRDFIEGMMPLRAHIPLVGRTIMRQQVMVLDALKDWIEEFKQEFEKEAKQNG